MENAQFVHLRLHSEYSIVDGLVRIEEAVATAIADKQLAMALTDLSNLFGLIKFYKAAREKGIKPIAGCDVWITNDADRERPSRLLLLVKNKLGYQNLCELLTKAWLENRYKDRAEFRMEWLETLSENNTDTGLIALSGARQGNIGMALESSNIENADSLALRWARIFRGSFYIEIQRTGQLEMEQYVRQAVELADKLHLPVVATHPIQFLTKDQFRAHEARICISEKEILSDKKREHLFNEQQYFLTQKEMIQLFADLPGALQNTIEIARRCNLVLELGHPKLPFFPTEGVPLDEFLTNEARRGLEKRLETLFPDEKERKAKRSVYDERLSYEIDIIIKMGFSGYFLIVADFIRWAKKEKIPVGPGRGSGAGSLVAYSLLITNLDPIAYNLIFERFLNPERVSMPDFDVDFCQLKRDKVIHYVKEKYGKDAVSQIATFGTMAAKAAVRDVGRVLALGYNFCDGISKLIPFKSGKQVKIADVRKEEPILAKRDQSEEEVKQLLDLAEQVEGITRNVGMHAGGVLIAPGKLTNFCPLYTQDGEEGVVSQFDKKDIEEIGLVKFDFLGLTTLTILDQAINDIYDLDRSQERIELDAIPLDDRETFELLTQANTIAVFQFESFGMQKMLKDAKPDRLEDLIALVALYRPGPMSLIPDFCRRKHGEAFEYPDERVKNILSETYGIMVYQEQVMQMAQVIGGYTLGGADLLRRAMGKKDTEGMEKHRQVFRDGAAKNNLSEAKADEIFDLMSEFAKYGFNKSHAAAYALLAYQTAYLKRHYPAAFMAANMSFAMNDADKITTLVKDAIDVCGLEILPPDINESVYFFKPIRNATDTRKNSVTQIRYGLGAVKGSGEGAINAIVQERENGGAFKDLFDFCARVDKQQISRRTIESLIRAGAFDGFGEDRAVLLASVGLALDAAKQAEASANQVSLFEGEDAILNVVDYVRVLPWTEKYKLMEEKNALGFWLSGHLFHVYAKEAHQFVRMPLSQIQKNREPKWMAGIIVNIRSRTKKFGEQNKEEISEEIKEEISEEMKEDMIVSLDDGSTIIDVTVPLELFERKNDIFKKDEFLAVFTAARRYNGSSRGQMFNRITDAMNIAEARCYFGQHITFSLSNRFSLSSLKEILTSYRSDNGMRLIINYRTSENECQYDFGENWLIFPSDECIEELVQHFDDVHVVY